MPRFSSCCPVLVLMLVFSHGVNAGIQNFRGLGDAPGGSFHSSASSVSADGSVAVGRSVNGAFNQASRWTLADGMVSIGDLPGGFTASQSFGVSGDGAVVVGVGEFQYGR
jgi:uncharacterized membrane protein